MSDQTEFELETNISTDVICPTKGVASEPEELSLYALSGHPEIEEKSIKTLGPEILIVGPGFGRGSSREHAFVTLEQAGVRAIICIGGMFERIFKENCALGGIAIYEIPDQLNTVQQLQQAWKKDQIEKAYQDQIRPDIADSGGIIGYTLKRLKEKVEPVAICHNEVRPNHPMTAAEKILARRMSNVHPNSHGEKVVLPGDTGFIPVDFRMSYEAHGPLINLALFELTKNTVEGVEINDPSSIRLFQDHFAQRAREDPGSKQADFIRRQQKMAEKYRIPLCGLPAQEGYTPGICHTLTVEKALIGPGEIGVGTDSHTCTWGVLNSLSWGIGATHMASTMVTKEAFIEVPPTIKITLSGKLNQDTSPKDVALHLLSQDFIKEGASTGCVLEITGKELKNWILDMQLVICNMAVEARFMTAIITQLTPALRKHLERTRNMSAKKVEEKFIQSDPNADFLLEQTINLGEIKPMIALSGDPINTIPLSKLKKLLLLKPISAPVLEAIMMI